MPLPYTDETGPVTPPGSEAPADEPESDETPGSVHSSEPGDVLKAVLTAIQWLQEITDELANIIESLELIAESLETIESRLRQLEVRDEE